VREFSNDDIDTMRLLFTCIDTSTAPITRRDLQTSLLNIAFIQDAGERGTRIIQLEIESMAGVSRNLQPPAHDLTICMP